MIKHITSLTGANKGDRLRPTLDMVYTAIDNTFIDLWQLTETEKLTLSGCQNESVVNCVWLNEP